MTGKPADSNHHRSNYERTNRKITLPGILFRAIDI